MFVEVRDKPDITRFIKVGKNPARFFLKEKESLLTEDILKKIDKEEQKPKKETHSYNERDLHPLLAYFMSHSPTFPQVFSISIENVEQSLLKILSNSLHNL